MSQFRSRLPRLLLFALAVGGLGWITPGGGLVGVLLGVGALVVGFLLGSGGTARTGSSLSGAVEPPRPPEGAATPPPPGDLAGRVVHDLNNVLTVISGRADILLAVLPGDHPAREDVVQIRRAGRDATRIAARLRPGAPPDPPAPELLSPGRLMEELLPGLRSLLGGDQTLTLRVEEPLPRVAAGRPEVEQVLGNLVRNAGQAMPEGGTVTLSLSAKPGWLNLVVEDSGVGMSDEVRRQAFDPFFSGWAVGGSGIGLSTVQGLVRRMGGRVELESWPGRGSRVLIRLPAASPAEADAPEPEEASPRWNSAGETVLVVEDDPVLRALAERILLGRGYHVLPAGSGAEALDLAADPELAIDLVLSDVVLPGMGGPETVGRLMQSGRRLRVLYMSGYNDDHLAAYGVLVGGVELLRKPFDPDSLARKVRQVLDA